MWLVLTIHEVYRILFRLFSVLIGFRDSFPSMLDATSS